MARGAAQQVDDQDDQGGGGNDDAPEPTLRETLESARDEALAKYETQGPADEPIADPVSRAAYHRQNGGRERDAGGRFAPAARTTSADTSTNPAGNPQAPAGNGQAADPQGNGGAAQGGQQPAGVEQPPQSWSAAEKALWKDVPAAARATIARREAEFHRKLTAHDEVRSIGNEFIRTATEFAPVVQRTGMTPAQLLRQYLGTIQTMQTADPMTKARLFGELAGKNGIDLRLAVQALQPQGGAPGGAAASTQTGTPAVHPMVMQLAQQVQQLTRAQQEAAQRQQQEQQEAARRADEETQSEIEVFRSTPGHEHFEALHPLMAAMLRGGTAQTLEEAYTQAARAHPAISAQIQAQAQAQAADRARQRQQVDKARRKGGSVQTGAGGFIPVSGSKGSVRADLEAAAAEARSRV